MVQHDNEHGLTRGQLVEVTGCPPYLVSYYSQCGYLPIARPSPGPGTPILYDPRAVEVIQIRMRRRVAVPFVSKTQEGAIN